jgi:putative peptidoglycan lipid II flippase
MGPSEDREAHQERESFFGAAKLMAALTLLSRILGLVRDMSILRLGANRLTDSFWTAFSIPNLFRRLFGEGALSAAFVPVMTEVAETKGWQRARKVFANALGLLALLLAGVLVLVETGAGLWLAWLWARGGSWDRLLLLQLILLVMPFMVTICLLALASATLQCKGRFGYPAFAPILLNLCMIAAAWAIARWGPQASWQGVFVLAVSVSLAGIVQLIGAYWLLARVQLAVLPKLRPLLPEVRRIARLTLPMLVPLGVLQLSAFFDQFYAWWMTATEGNPNLHLLGWTLKRPLETGVVSCLYGANRLYQLPMGILAISLATAVFPLLSRYASRGDTAGLRDATNRALRLSLFLGIPSGVALILLADPIIELLFGHGRFDAHDVGRTASILRMYSLGLWAYFCNHILLRAFFAQKDSRTPLRISCMLAAVNVVLVATLVFTPLKASAIGLATALTASANAVLLTAVLRKRWKAIGARQLAASLTRTLLAAAAMGAAIWLTKAWGLAALGIGDKNKTGQALTVGLSSLAGVAVFFLSAFALRCREPGELLGKAKSR